MFWNSASHPVYGRTLRSSGLSPEEAMIQMDGGWDGFMASVPADEDLVKMDAKQIAEHAGLKDVDLEKTLSSALHRWRINPASSLVNIVKVDTGSAGQPLFRDIREQSHILAAACASNAIAEGTLRAVVEPETRKLWKLSGDYYAMTALDKAADTVNGMARAFKIWEAKNQASVRLGNVKLPKKLFRGIRSIDISLDSQVIPDADNHYVRTVHKILAKQDILTTKALAKISHSDVLSFTSNERIAEFFTRREGLVIEVDPRDLLIVCSCATDDGLNSVDYVTGKHEREWIMRTGDLQLKHENIKFYDEDAALVMRDPRCIEMLSGFHHVVYEMNDMRIRANFQWNSAGTGGKVIYRPQTTDFVWPLSRSEFKREHGFDPIPKIGQDVKIIDCWSEDTLFRKKTKIPEWIPGLECKPNP